MKNWTKKEKWLSIYLCIIYLVGIVGIALPLHADFVKLTPLNLCVSLIIVFFGQKHFEKNLFFIVFLNYLIGFVAEAIGINGGWLFGDFYTYGEAMGCKIFQTPLTAGLIWVIVSFGVASFINRAFEEKSFLTKSIFGALILVSLDVLIEPVAIKLNFWRWQHQIVPFQNYVSWFGIAFLILLLYNIFLPKLENRIAEVLLILQFIFFGIFNFL